MDNFRFCVISDGASNFKRALLLALQLRGYSKTTHYSIDKEHGMVFYWSDPVDLDEAARKYVAPIPFSMDAEALETWAESWLRTADYGPTPGYDATCEKGWKIYNDNWGHVAGSRYGIIGIKPEWALYGK